MGICGSRKDDVVLITRARSDYTSVASSGASGSGSGTVGGLRNSTSATEPYAPPKPVVATSADAATSTDSAAVPLVATGEAEAKTEGSRDSALSEMQRDCERVRELGQSMLDVGGFGDIEPSMMEDERSSYRVPPTGILFHKLPSDIGASIFEFISIVECVLHCRTSQDVKRFALRALRRPRAFGVLPARHNLPSRTSNQALVRKFGALCPRLQRFVAEGGRSVHFSMMHPADYAFRSGMGVHVATLLQLPCSQHLRYLCIEDDETNVYPLENIEELVPYPRKFLPSLQTLDIVSERAVVNTAPLWRFMSLWSWVPRQKLILVLSSAQNPQAVIDFSLLLELRSLRSLALIFSHPDFASPQAVFGELARCLPMSLESVLIRVIVKSPEVDLWRVELADMKGILTDIRKMNHLEFESTERWKEDGAFPRVWLDLAGKPKPPPEKLRSAFDPPDDEEKKEEEEEKKEEEEGL